MSFGENLDELVERTTNGLVGKHPSWERIKVGDVATLVNGYAFKSSFFNEEDGIPIVRIRDIVKGAPGTYYKGPLDDPKMTVIDNGQIVIGMDGDFNCGIWHGGRALLNQRVCTLQTNEETYSQAFLAYVLPGYLKLINDHTSSVTVKHLSSLTVKDIPLPLPPLNEQRRIVEKIETLFARLDQGEAALRQVQKLLARYRQSVLKAAVTGELTRYWRAENAHRLEHGRDLLARILQTRRDTWRGRGRYKEPATPDTTGLPDLPEGWAWATVEQLAFVETGATPKRTEPRYYDPDGTPWVTSTAVNADIVAECQDRISDLALKETNTKVFPKGSLIVAMYGEGKTRGKIASLGIDAATNQACAALLVSHLDNSVSKYLKRFFEYNYEAIRMESSGGVQPNLNLSIIKNTCLPVPGKQ
jgi:type I restriction enzyme S subunit